MDLRLELTGHSSQKIEVTATENTFILPMIKEHSRCRCGRNKGGNFRAELSAIIILYPSFLPGAMVWSSVISQIQIPGNLY